MSRFLTYLLAAMASIYIAVSLGYISHPNFNSAPVAVEQPEQLRYVVYFWVCDNLVGVLIPGAPAYWASKDQDAPDEMIAIMLEAETNNRFYNIEHFHRGCPSLQTPHKT